ncbi:MAG: glycosyltransferase family 2 protein [Gemmatimonadetes bacterium]|nr:glycosyltransferase family 2 protein [Gemmatimonadota bacterium]
MSQIHRELPEFEEVTFGPRIHTYALVIPVINEGERIRAQLRRIRAAVPRVDVIVADGGSTDGSVDPSFLAEVGVRALLIKRGAGRLSAQLRMAYAWVLDQGYSGVVTIDGNGKDGVEAIDAFVARLKEGFDYVQGSRYAPGGKAVNTPLDRMIAGRLLHAPLLSLAGRRRYTDTTNGYRGYSARYLTDEHVSPFRDVFDRYSLLFYLTIRAGQLGYRTTELPVTRVYPADEVVPTKIHGLRGKLPLLMEMFSVALGRYHPR